MRQLDFSFQLDVDLNSSHVKSCKLKVCIVGSRMLSSSRSLYVHTCCSRLVLTRVNQLGTNVPTKCTITQQTHNANKQRANTLCRQSWRGVQGRRKTLPHTSVQTHAANHQGLRGGICGEGMARTDPSFPHHACDSALFTLSWRVAPFDQAGEARGWVVVLTKSQCAVCRQGNFPGWLCVLTCVDWGSGWWGGGRDQHLKGPKIKQISADFLAPSLLSGVSAPPTYLFFFTLYLLCLHTADHFLLAHDSLCILQLKIMKAICTGFLLESG